MGTLKTIIFTVLGVNFRFGCGLAMDYLQHANIMMNKV